MSAPRKYFDMIAEGIQVETIMKFRPDYTITDDSDRPVFQSWVLDREDEEQFNSCQVELHRFLSADLPHRFHSHPAQSFRLILSGGYVEEIVLPHCEKEDVDMIRTEFRVRRPGYFGMVSPDMTHRVDKLLAGPSVSLWFRGPRVAPVTLYGRGWGDKHLSQDGKAY